MSACFTSLLKTVCSAGSAYFRRKLSFCAVADKSTLECRARQRISNFGFAEISSRHRTPFDTSPFKCIQLYRLELSNWAGRPVENIRAGRTPRCGTGSAAAESPTHA